MEASLRIRPVDCADRSEADRRVGNRLAVRGAQDLPAHDALCGARMRRDGKEPGAHGGEREPARGEDLAGDQSRLPDSGSTVTVRLRGKSSEL
jgi:hypothetical protein